MLIYSAGYLLAVRQHYNSFITCHNKARAMQNSDDGEGRARERIREKQRRVLVSAMHVCERKREERPRSHSQLAAITLFLTAASR